MTRLDPSLNTTVTPVRTATPPAASVAVTRPVGAAPDRTNAGLDALLVKLGPPYAKLLQATRAGDMKAADAALADLAPLLEAGRGLTAGSRYAEAFAKVESTAAAVRAQVPVPTREMVVGLPGRGARVVQVAEGPAPQARTGPQAWLGRIADSIGSGLKTVGHIAFFPLELAGRVLDPVRAGAGKLLTGARTAIDESIGQIPVLGQAVRFTTGFTASLVGLVDGALQGVTHPVELVEGLGHIAWSVIGLVPGVRTAWDVAVNGQTVGESLKHAWGEAGNLGQALIGGALEDARAGNWSGALGRLTGDIGSFFVTGGAAAGAKVVGTTGTVAKAGRLARVVEAVGASRVGRIAQAARLEKVVATGAKAIEVANMAGAKILMGGMRGNLVAWKGAGKLVRRTLPGGKAVVRVSETAAVRTAKPLATPAATMDRPKVASQFTPESLGGEIRPAQTLTREQALAKQPAVIRDLNGPALNERLFDRWSGGMFDANVEVMASMKGLRLDGKAVTTMDDAVKAWNALPANAPQRATIGRKLAENMQAGFQEGFGFQPATFEFKALPENLAGMESGGRVLLDPALLNEPLDFIVHVMAEEQTHAYQRFLVENVDAIQMPDRLRVHVDKFAKDFAHEQYIYPPSKALTTLADDMKRLSQGAADHADEIDYAAVRRSMVKEMAAGTPERAVLDAWWARTGDESQKLSFYKYAEQELGTMMRGGGKAEPWLYDFRERLPASFFERDGVKLTAEQTRAALKQAIGESQTSLRGANAEVASYFNTWDDAYRGQSLEFIAKATADEVAQWIMAQ